jgi:hypothetical protein
MAPILQLGFGLAMVVVSPAPTIRRISDLPGALAAGRSQRILSSHHDFAVAGGGGWRLAVAISDLNEGRTDALLAPTPTGGVNPGVPTAQWLGRANVALGMVALIAAGNTRKLAAKEGQTNNRN